MKVPLAFFFLVFSCNSVSTCQRGVHCFTQVYRKKKEGRRKTNHPWPKATHTQDGMVVGTAHTHTTNFLVCVQGAQCTLPPTSTALVLTNHNFSSTILLLLRSARDAVSSIRFPKPTGAQGVKLRRRRRAGVQDRVGMDWGNLNAAASAAMCYICSISRALAHHVEDNAGDARSCHNVTSHLI